MCLLLTHCINTVVIRLTTSYILTKFLFYRLSDNILMKRYSLCVHRGDKKAFKETKIYGVIASRWILFIWRFFLLSQKMNWVSYLPFPLYITNHKNIYMYIYFDNLLEFRQQICHWNVLIALGYWYITLLKSSFTINLYSFYVKIWKPLAKTWKLSTVARRLSSLECFPWDSFECTDVKINFQFFRIDYKIVDMYQKWGATLKWGRSSPGKGLIYTFKDGMANYYTVCSNKCILKAFKFLANNLDINFTWTHCTSMITF